MTETRRSETIGEIAKALVAAQAEIGRAVKDAANPHFKSSYADLTSVIDAVKDPLNKHGIALLQPVSTIGSDAFVTTLLLHSSGEFIESTLRIPATKGDAQGLGSAISYGRRYGLQSMLRVPTADDDGNAAAEPRPSPTEPRYAAGAEPAASAATPGLYAFRFGKHKGKTLDQVPREYVEWIRDETRKSLSDPTKAKFYDKNKSEMEEFSRFLGEEPPAENVDNIPF